MPESLVEGDSFHRDITRMVSTQKLPARLVEPAVSEENERRDAEVVTEKILKAPR
jgi:hypothetical protein